MAYASDFQDVIDTFPECQPIVPYLQRLPEGTSVEQQLERLQEETTEYPQRHKQIAAIRYYLHVLLYKFAGNWATSTARGVTNYKTLLDQVRRWGKRVGRTCLVTFNYDTLLESALPSVGVDITNIDSFISHDEFKLIKLHGSVNWVKLIESEVRGVAEREVWELVREFIANVSSLKISSSYMLVNDQPPPIVRYYGRPLFPAIAIPLERKLDFECPSDHLAVLRNLLPEVTKLLVIGWRATDNPFLEILREHIRGDARGIVVAGSEESARSIIERLQQVGIRGNFRPSGGGFSDFVIRREAEELFSE